MLPMYERLIYLSLSFHAFKTAWISNPFLQRTRHFAIIFQVRDKHSTVQRPNPKEKHGVWDSMPELTITSPYVHSRVDSNTFTKGNPTPPESTLTVC
jgi:hypothetical protein